MPATRSKDRQWANQLQQQTGDLSACWVVRYNGQMLSHNSHSVSCRVPPPGRHSERQICHVLLRLARAALDCCSNNMWFGSSVQFICATVRGGTAK